MSPIDKHLRDTLNEHAVAVADDGDRFALVERRARTMHRRRVAWASGGTAVVLAGVILGGVTLLGSDQDTVQAPIGNGESPTPSTSPSPVETPPPGAVAERSFLDWPYRQGDGVAAVDPVEHTLWAGVLPTGPTVVVSQTVDKDGNVRAIAYVNEPNKVSYQLDGAPLKPAVTNQVSFVLPGNAYPWVLVIGAPTTGQIEYAADGATYEPVETIDGWALFKRTGDETDRIRVLDGNGDLDHPLYEGPIDTGPSEPDV